MPCYSNLRALINAALALLLLASSAPAQPKAKPIDPATIAAFEKIGGAFGGWYRQGNYHVFEKEQPAADRGIPGFVSAEPLTGKLPEMAREFALQIISPSQFPP